MIAQQQAEQSEARDVKPTESENAVIAKKKTSLIQQFRRMIFLTAREKEFRRRIENGMDEGRKAAMLNVFKNGR